jgi:hypothetical protein
VFCATIRSSIKLRWTNRTPEAETGWASIQSFDASITRQHDLVVENWPVQVFIRDIVRSFRGVWADKDHSTLNNSRDFRAIR